MIVLKNDKLYLLSDKQLVGVNVYSDKVVPVEGSEVQARQPYRQVELGAVRRKFGVTEETPYMFPIKKKATSKRKAKATEK